MAFFLGYRSSLYLVIFTVFLNVTLSSAQFPQFGLFGLGRRRNSEGRSLPIRTIKARSPLDCTQCNDDTGSVVEFTSPSPYPEIWPSQKPDSPQVNLLGIAETCAANFITQDYEQNWVR